MNRPKRVRLRIDRLVVDGLPQVRADILADAIAEELKRLAARNEPPTPIGPELDVDLLQGPERGGREIAAVIHARLLAEVAGA